MQRLNGKQQHWSRKRMKCCVVSPPNLLPFSFPLSPFPSRNRKILRGRASLQEFVQGNTLLFLRFVHYADMLGMAPTFVFFCILASLYFSGQADLLNTPKHQRRVNDDTELFSDEESAYAHASTVSGGASEGSTVETMYVHGLIPASIVCVRCVRCVCARARACVYSVCLSV